MKNVTLSISEELLVKSREYAKKHGTTLNQMIRDLLKRYVEKEKGSIVGSILDHSKATAVSGKGYKWNRNDAYED